MLTKILFSQVIYIYIYIYIYLIQQVFSPWVTSKSFCYNVLRNSNTAWELQVSFKSLLEIVCTPLEALEKLFVVVSRLWNCSGVVSEKLLNPRARGYGGFYDKTSNDRTYNDRTSNDKTQNNRMYNDKRYNDKMAKETKRIQTKCIKRQKV